MANKSSNYLCLICKKSAKSLANPKFHLIFAQNMKLLFFGDAIHFSHQNAENITTIRNLLKLEWMPRVDRLWSFFM